MGISMFDPRTDTGLFRPVAASSEPSQESPSVTVPVVIIGGGPAGLLQAHLLSQLGGTLSMGVQAVLRLMVSSKMLDCGEISGETWSP